MTCIAGLAVSGAVHLAGDSAVLDGWDLRTTAHPKVWQCGPYVLGVPGALRPAQILRYSFAPPQPSRSRDLHAFMCTTFAGELRNCFTTAGWAVEPAADFGSALLVGVAGRVFMVSGDCQCSEFTHGYAAVGCGADYAVGALYATEYSGMSPRERLDMALMAAEAHSGGVRGPFTFVSTESSSDGEGPA